MFLASIITIIFFISCLNGLSNGKGILTELKNSTYISNSLRLKSFSFIATEFPVNGSFILNLKKRNLQPHDVLLTAVVKYRSNLTTIGSCNVTFSELSLVDEEKPEKRIFHWYFDGSGFYCRRSIVPWSSQKNLPPNFHVLINFTSRLEKSPCLSDLAVCNEIFNFSVSDCNYLNGSASNRINLFPSSSHCLTGAELTEVGCCENCSHWPTCPISATFGPPRLFPTPPAFPLNEFLPKSSFLAQNISQTTLFISTFNDSHDSTNYTLHNNGSIQDLDIMSILSPTSEEPNVTHNIKDFINTDKNNNNSENLCDCLNNGTCSILVNNSDNSNLAHCQCPAGFFGDRCEKIDSCHAEGISCLNGGSCVLLNETINFRNLSQIAKWLCVCLPNFSGEHCQIGISSTTLSMTTTTSGINITPPLFPLDQPLSTNDSGIFTTEGTISPSSDIYFCGSLCLNGGTCVGNSSKDAFCACPVEWQGGDPFCGNRTASTSPLSTTVTTSGVGIVLQHCGAGCQNGGQCKNGRCDCYQTGYTGKYCETDIDECNFSINPCKIHGSCKNTNGSFSCSCETGFTGTFCNETNTETLPSSAGSTNLGLIFGIIFGILALIGLSVGGFFLYRYINRSRKLKGKYNPAKEELNNVGGHPLPLSTLSTGERLI